MNESKFGPLGGLAGTWEGNRGTDIAPGETRDVMTTPYRECLQFEPLDEVTNHEQVLQVMRYSCVVWPEGKAEPFHEEVGYWLWDVAGGQVMKSFTVPRGYAILAGGKTTSDAREFSIRAEVGSEIYGICSSPFLKEEFRTVQFDCTVRFHEDGSFSYEEDTQLQIRGQQDIFHHRDSNRLRRID